jgi:hypothetical protein
MNLRIFAALAVILTVPGCSVLQGASTAANSSPSPTALADAKNTVFALKSGYGAALVLVVNWAKTPLCGAPGALPAPTCPTQPAINALAKADRVAGDAINKAETLALSASPDQSNLTLAIQTAQTAYGVFQGAIATYNVK